MDQNYLLQALELAVSRRGYCAPNPAVGAVIVAKQHIIARGCHQQAGTAHAEVVALQEAEGDVRGSTLYVTLEPCCHYGKTPPCTEAIIKAGISRVVYAYADPNPLVAGKGRQQLITAGIACDHIPVAEITAFYRSYQHWQQYKRPWLTAKLALSFDGKIAGAGNEPVAITGKALQAITHQYRLRSDAILTSAVTINNDNPQLNVRCADKIIATKPVYIIDRLLTINLQQQIFTSAQAVTILHSINADQAKISLLEAQGVRCVALAENNNALDLTQVLAFLGEEGLHDVWLEAGGRLFEACLHQQLLNTAFIYIAPKILGEPALNAFSQTYSFLTAAKQIQWHAHGEDALCQIDFTTE